MTTNQIAEIETMAATVAQEFEAQQAAINAERDAEASVLALAIAAARPALRAVSSKIARKQRSTSGRNGCNPVDETEHFEERGLMLVDLYERERDSSGDRGSFGGTRLWLLADGRLAETTREGSWSCWQGEWDRCDATMQILAPREAMEAYELQPCLDAITGALQKQVGKRNTTAARARTEKLAAIASLAAPR